MKSLTLPGEIQSLEPMADFIHEAAAEAGLDKKVAYKLHLAVDEIITNVITHGYEEQGLKGEIEIRAEITPQSLTIVVEDSSPAFDPRTLDRPPSLDMALEDRPIGGLGVYLTLRSVDRFDYTHADGKNRNTFVVNRAQPA